MTIMMMLDAVRVNMKMTGWLLWYLFVQEKKWEHVILSKNNWSGVLVAIYVAKALLNMSSFTVV